MRTIVFLFLLLTLPACAGEHSHYYGGTSAPATQPARVHTASLLSNNHQSWDQEGYITLMLGVIPDNPANRQIQDLKGATAQTYSELADPFYQAWKDNRLPLYTERCLPHRVYVWRAAPTFSPTSVRLYGANRQPLQLKVLDPRYVPVPVPDPSSNLGPVQAVFEINVCGEGGIQFNWRDIDVNHTYLVICAPVPMPVGLRLVAPNRDFDTTAALHFRPSDWRAASRNQKSGYLTGAGWEVVFLPEVVASDRQ